MELIDQIAPFIWFFSIAGFGYLFMRKFIDVIKEKLKASITIKKKEDSEKSVNSIDKQLDQLVDNAPDILRQLDNEIKDQRARGVTDDQMKGLLSKKQMLEFAVNNKEIIDIIGKPVLKRVLGWVKNF